MRNKVAGAGLFVGAAALLISLAGQVAIAQEKDPNGQGGVLAVGGSEIIDPNQPIKVGFVLSVRVESAVGAEPDLTGSFTVDPSGSIQLKLAGGVQVRGLTPIQAGDKIAVALKPYIKDPKVQVAILSTPKPIVILGGLAGSVPHARATVVSDTTTLGDLLTVLGTGDNADLTRVRITRRDEKGNRTVKEYTFLRWAKPGPGETADEAQHPVLSDDDVVYVPPETFAPAGNITIEGAVVRPGIVPVRNGVPMTLREVVSQAGGPTPTAERRQISVRRLGVERPMFVDYDKMEAGDPQNNIPLQTDDIVYVETLGKYQFVNLNGALVRPGKLPYTEAITITQAIGEAGGVQLGAKTKEGRVFRHNVPGDPTKTQVFAFNYDEIRKNKQSDILLEPGDTIEIPQGNAPRQALTPLEFTQSLLSIALIVDRLVSGNRGYSGF